MLTSYLFGEDVLNECFHLYLTGKNFALKDFLSEIITMKVYLAKTKLFAVQTIASTGKETNASVDQFFASFQIK